LLPELARPRLRTSRCAPSGTIRVVGTTVSFDKLAEPTAVQRRALGLLEGA
jgi:hypothetical protein